MNKAALETLIAGLVSDFAPVVKEIESSMATTKNHYGRYMAILSMANGNKQHAQIFAIALVRAGANGQGVQDALRVSFP